MTVHSRQIGTPQIGARQSGWQAQLTLGFGRDQSGVTRLAHRRHRGPLQVQRPFYPEGDGTCHVYILHPPGGVVGGDELSVDVALARGSQVLLTTPAAGKFYRSRGPTARQAQTLRIGADAALEWLPQENIVFQGARVDCATRVELEPGARFLGWEILCLGRPAAGEGFQAGHCRQRFEIWREGLPLVLDRGGYRGGAELLRAPWGLRGLPVTGILIAVGAPPGLAQTVRTGLEDSDSGELFSATELDGALVCRYLGPNAARARDALRRAWERLRPPLFGKKACAPRIWNT